MYQKARNGYTILEFVSEEKCPRFCLCRRPLLFFGHFLKTHTRTHTLALALAHSTSDLFKLTASD